MSFLHPWALAGLLAAAVPILLHLIQRREPPTVMFPAVRYLHLEHHKHTNDPAALVAALEAGDADDLAASMRNEGCAMGR